MAKYIIDPMCRGICAGDAKEISVRSLLPVMYNAEKKHGSVIKGMLKSKLLVLQVSSILWELCNRIYKNYFSILFKKLRNVPAISSIGLRTSGAVLTYLLTNIRDTE